MKQNFNHKYARYYDLIYTNKDYRKECSYLEELFNKFLKAKPRAILDLACGTASHALILSARGYKLTGADLSGAMINIAARKARLNRQKIKFYVKSMQDLKTKQKFDAVISMFSAVNYLKGPGELNKALANIRSLLKKGGILVFDFWNAFAVLNHYEPRKVKILERPGIKVKRVSLTSLDRPNKIARVKFKCFIFGKNKLKDTIEETHEVRFFFPSEIKQALKASGFKILGVFPFLSLKKRISSNDWNITVVAKR